MLALRNFGQGFRWAELRKTARISGDKPHMWFVTISLWKLAVLLFGHSQEKGCGAVHGLAEPRSVVPKRMRSARQQPNFGARPSFTIAACKINRLTRRNRIVRRPMQQKHWRSSSGDVIHRRGPSPLFLILLGSNMEKGSHRPLVVCA